MKLFARMIVLGLCAASSMAQAALEPDAAAAALLARHAALEARLQQNAFQRPLHLDSSEPARTLRGDVHAVLNYPFAVVAKQLDDPAHWCDILILHINTKYCHAAGQPGQARLAVYIGKKTEVPLGDAHRTEFTYQVAAMTPAYFSINLGARQGPYGTSDYQVVLEAVPLADGRTFIHLSYAYAYNLAGKLAMQTYLGTVASDKVGFTRRDDRSGSYVGGVRGLVERTTMRYYLAIDAFLDAAGKERGQQLERRLQTWFAASEQYPRQLHEVDRSAYLVMKRSEYRRQQSPE